MAYPLHPIRTWKTPGSMGLIPDTRLDSVTAAFWAEAWRDFKAEQKINDADWDGATLITPQTGANYYLYLRASLAMATHAGAPEARECYEYIAAELPAAMRHYNARGAARWSIDPAG